MTWWGDVVLSAIWPAIYLVGSYGYALHKRLGEGGYVPEEGDLRTANLRQVEGLTWQQIRSARTDAETRLPPLLHDPPRV